MTVSDLREKLSTVPQGASVVDNDDLPLAELVVVNATTVKLVFETEE